MSPHQSHCDGVRRQKEQELEVLCGSVRGWEGEEPSKLGELIYMGPVKILPTPSSPEVKDRHLVLFSQCVVLLSVNQQLSAFVFEVNAVVNQRGSRIVILRLLSQCRKRSRWLEWRST